MRKIKRILALLLAASALAGLLVCPASAAPAASAAFRDISDPAVAEAAEVLRLLGVVSGTDSGRFSPGQVLTRAEFCKMTVEIMGRGDQEPAQRSRTIFLDVGPGHWARGYVNLASTITLGGSSGEGGSTAGGTRLIMGIGDGTFEPDRKISYGEAVTILMRVLGYGDGDVSAGASWYDGYMAMAAESGLTDGLNLDPAGEVNRGQAALLFYNLLFTKSKGSGALYLTTLGAKQEAGGIILDVDATAADGTTGAVKTTTGTYKTDRTSFAESLEGMQGDLLLDKDGKLLAFQVKDNLTQRSVSVSEWAYNHVVASDKSEVSVDPDTVIYVDGVQKIYKDVWQDMKKHTPLTVCYTSAGRIDYLFYQSNTAAETALVAKNKPSGTSNPFSGLVGRADSYQIYKNGVPATVADIRQYDAATYDDATNILQVSDLRITGVYENVYPNLETPATIQLLGAEFDVLPSAVSDLRAFQLGQTVTLLLTVDGQVAGVVSSNTLRSNAVGVVTAISSGSATVEPLNDALPELKGQISYTDSRADAMTGQLVTVSSNTAGRITLTRLSGNGARGTLDLSTGMAGNVPLAPNVVIYERVGASRPKAIELDDITCSTVPADKIPYVRTDYAGRISLMILDDVTGDAYTYGHVRYTSRIPGEGSSPDTSATVSVTNVAGTVGPVDCDRQFANNTLMGIAATADGKLAGAAALMSRGGISRDAFDVENQLLILPDMVLPISDEVCCYNRTTQRWFGSADDPKGALNQARAFSNNLTIYYDKAPEDGGKVRIVVVE